MVLWHGMNLRRVLSKKTSTEIVWQPVIFDLRKQKDTAALGRLFARRLVHYVVDDYEEQVREYYQVLNPTYVYSSDFEAKFLQYRTSLEKRTPLWQQGRWVYFPWLSVVTHILEDKAFQLVRTARNRNLITTQEQEKFYRSRGRSFLLRSKACAFLQNCRMGRLWKGRQTLMSPNMMECRESKKYG